MHSAIVIFNFELADEAAEVARIQPAKPGEIRFNNMEHALTTKRTIPCSTCLRSASLCYSAYGHFLDLYGKPLLAEAKNLIEMALGAKRL